MSTLDAVVLKNERDTINRKLRKRELSLGFSNIVSLVEGTLDEVLMKNKDEWRDLAEAENKALALKVDFEQRLTSATNMVERVYYKAKLNVIEEILDTKEVL